MTKKDIKKYYTEENTVRWIAALVVVTVFVALRKDWSWLLFLLTIDFALRAFTYQPSLLAALAKLIVTTTGVKQRPQFAAPKKFAAAIGFFVALITAILLHFHFYPAALTTGSILIFFALLESLFKICVGCTIYNKLYAPFVNKYRNSFPK